MALKQATLLFPAILSSSLKTCGLIRVGLISPKMWVNDAKYPQHQMHHQNCSFSWRAEAGSDSMLPAFLCALLGYACVCGCSGLVTWDRLLQPPWFKQGKKQASKRQIPVQQKHKSTWKEDSFTLQRLTFLKCSSTIGGLHARLCSPREKVKRTVSAGEINNLGEIKACWAPRRQEQTGRTGTKANSSQLATLEALLCVAAILRLDTSCWNGPSFGSRGRL